MVRWFMVPLLILSLVRVDITYFKDQPLWNLWGSSQNTHWDESSREWVNNNVQTENWRRQLPETTWFGERWYWEYVRWKLLQPERVPVKRRVVVELRHDLCRRPEFESPLMAVAIFVQQEKIKRRLVLINVEQNADCEEQYRVWPHLGMNVVGTVAHEEGWEVVLHDEFIQGHVDLAKIVQPEDVVGLSLVVSGMDRGLELARQAKKLGAAYVITGNDAAIFRARQLLAIPDRPVDAVFTSNSTNAVRRFFREITRAELPSLRIPEVATRWNGAAQHSNESSILRLELLQRRADRASGADDPMDGFVIPRLDLFGPGYWNAIWTTYRSQYGHKHLQPENVRGATVHFAQGCTRTQGKDACTYCTIFGIGDIRIPSETYLAALIERYQAFGITNFYNVTDSAYEMRPLVDRLHQVGFRTDGLIIYGRAHGLARQPDLLEAWLGLVNDRFMINCGMDSGDERILTQGVFKSSTKGSRTDENRQAILNLRGSGAHLHYSLIFGSPGETPDTCERSLEFVQWVADTLGPQCDVLESDIYWLNFGSAAAQVFHDYDYAVQLAAIAGKTISREAWYRDFGQYADALSVPRSAQEAWYHHFTQISLDEALAYVRQASDIMDRHPGRVKGRVYAFKRPDET